MTGTTDLTIDQFLSIEKHLSANGDIKSYVRLIITPITLDYHTYRGTIKVTTRSLCFGDVLEGHFYVLPNGERLTGKEWSELVGDER